MVLTSSPEFLSSWTICACISTGVLPVHSAPEPALLIQLTSSGDAMALTKAALSLATTAGGVLAGATTPCQYSETYPFRPASLTVGTSGMAVLRLLPLVLLGNVVNVGCILALFWGKTPSHWLVAWAVLVVGGPKHAGATGGPARLLALF